MTCIEITPFDLVERIGPVLSVMAKALDLDDAGSRDRERVVRRHAERPGLITRGAFTDDRLVGFCYGFPDDRHAWWEQQIRPQLLASGTADWLDDGAFELTELHVHPDHQGNGIGRELITRVLDAADLPRALLTVRVSGAPARRLYGSLGFRELTAPFRFGPGQPPYLVMGATLPVPAEAPVRRRVSPALGVLDYSYRRTAD